MNIDQIAMNCISIDSSERALQTKEKLFEISFRNFGWKIFVNIKNMHVNINQVAMCYISIDSSRQALQTKMLFSILI